MKNNPKAESSVHRNGQTKTPEKSPKRFEGKRKPDFIYSVGPIAATVLSIS